MAIVVLAKTKSAYAPVAKKSVWLDDHVVVIVVVALAVTV
jgi:hypothetical protein